MRRTMKAHQNFLNSLLRPRMARSTIYATRCHCVTIVWVCLVSFATITLCNASSEGKKKCLKFGFKLDETALEILEMELVFTITTQKPKSNPLSGKAYPLHVCRKQEKVTSDICD